MEAKRYWTSFVNDLEKCPPLVDGTLAVCMHWDVLKLEARIKELEADLEDSRLIAREQEDAHVSAKMRAYRDMRIARLEDAVRWACGEIGEFPGEDPAKGRYHWRKELRQRSGVSYSAPSEPGVEI